MVELRDGIHLATDVYRPPDSEPLPAIIERTPYNRRGVSPREVAFDRKVPLPRDMLARWLATQGYAVVVQDVRGRYESEGVFTKYLHEAEDGFDTYSWIVDQDWCDGRILSHGLSYAAHTQLAAACAGAPGLSAMLLDTGGLLNAYKHSVRCGGAFELKQLTWAFTHAIKNAVAAGDTEVVAKLRSVNLRNAIRSANWRRGESPLAIVPEYESYLFDIWEAETPTEEWLGPSTCAERWVENIPDIPIALVGCWNDPYASNMTELFQQLQQQLSSPTRLTMGPWLHGERSNTYAGEAEFGPQCTLDAFLGLDYAELRRRWFDFALQRSEEDPFSHDVSYFVMGGEAPSKTATEKLYIGGEWQHSRHWPPEQVAPQFYYLDETGGLVEKPTRTDVLRRFTFDPEDPFPTVGGAVIESPEPIMLGGIFNQASLTNDRRIFDRRDVLVFESQPLPHDLVIAGACQLQVSTTIDTHDADIVAILFDVYNDFNTRQCTALNITDGIQRLRFRKGYDEPKAVKPGVGIDATIELLATSYRVPASHRIRLLITASNFPRFDLNPGTGEPWPRAKNPVQTIVEVSLLDTHLAIPAYRPVT